jgi:hypothetical protein
MNRRDVCTAGSTTGETHGINEVAVRRPEAGETPGSDVEDSIPSLIALARLYPNGAGIDFRCSFSIGRKKRHSK